MKRELIQNTKVAPYANGDVIDRRGFLSAIFAATIATNGDLIITFTHSDGRDGTYEPVSDEYVVVDNGTATDGVVTITVSAGDTANVDIDLVGCKRYVKITASGAAATGATYAYAIGDPEYAPV